MTTSDTWPTSPVDAGANPWLMLGYLQARLDLNGSISRDMWEQAIRAASSGGPQNPVSAEVTLLAQKSHSAPAHLTVEGSIVHGVELVGHGNAGGPHEASPRPVCAFDRDANPLGVHRVLDLVEDAPDAFVRHREDSVPDRDGRHVDAPLKDPVAGVNGCGASHPSDGPFHVLADLLAHISDTLRAAGRDPHEYDLDAIADSTYVWIEEREQFEARPNRSILAGADLYRREP